MTKRFAPVLFAGVALVGCASPAPSEELAMEPELAQTWQALTIAECADQNAQCIADAGFDLSDQVYCATELTDCLVDQGVETTAGIVECGLENTSCTVDGVLTTDPNAIIDCQQEVASCIESNTEDLTGVDLSPALEVVDGVIDVVQDATDDVVDDTIDNITSQLECNEQAAECLVGNIWNFAAVRECRNEFLQCSANVVEDVVQDAVEILTGDLDCRDVYYDCRDDGGSISECAAKRRDCENAAGN